MVAKVSQNNQNLFQFKIIYLFEIKKLNVMKITHYMVLLGIFTVYMEGMRVGV